MGTKIATFAGGCFWCMQPPFEQEAGVEEVLAGYTGGKLKDPTYDDYISKGHTEAVQIKFDPEKLSYERLLEIFWQSINPTDAQGQFADRGPGYYAGIYVHDDAQRQSAEKSKKELDQSGRFQSPVLTPILPALDFYPAEKYHQFYSKKNPLHYNFYKTASGRAAFLKEHWKH